MITVSIKLGSALDQYRPDGETAQPFNLTIEPDSSINALIGKMGIPEAQMLLVLLNGDIVHKKDRASTTLSDSDALSVMPPLYAG